MSEIIVYSQPGCGPCSKVKSWFDSKGVSYVEKNVVEDGEALQHIRSLGYAGVPVIETPEKHWSGIDLNNMKELVNA